jgi:hypothetical protein
MTLAHRLVYLASGIAVLVAIVIMVMPISPSSHPKTAGERPTPAPERRSLSEDASRLAEAMGERLAVNAPGQPQQLEIVQGPPKVIGVARVAGRGLAYVGEGPKPRRLAIGQSAGGWTLIGVGGNYAEFRQGATIRRVRLFAETPKASARDDDVVAEPAKDQLLTAPTDRDAQASR